MSYHCQLIVLAAGNSSRFNGAKINLEHPVSGYPLWLHQVSLFPAPSLLPIVIQGAHALRGPQQSHLEYQTVRCPNWRDGLSQSLNAGLSRLSPRASHFMVVLADQVMLLKSDIHLLLSESQQYPDCVVASQYENVIGAPVIFRAKDAAALAKLTGDQGAGKLLSQWRQQESHCIRIVSCPNGAIDIDTVADWESFLANDI